MSGLSHKIGDHVTGWAPLNSEFLLFDSIRYEVVTDIDVIRALAARGFAILFEEYGTPIVLIDNILTDFVSLSLDKLSCPTDGWHTVIYSHQSGLGGASGVALLLRGGHYWESTSGR